MPRIKIQQLIVCVIFPLFFVQCAQVTKSINSLENSVNQKMHSASTEIKQIVQEVKWNINQTAQKYLAHNDILYGIKQFNSKDYKVAEFYLKKGLLLFPDDPKALKYLAWTYFFQKRYDKSLTTFQQARSFSPKDPNPVIGAAWSYYGIKYFQKALDTLETAESITPWNYEVFKGKGEIVLYCEHLLSVLYKLPAKFKDKIQKK